MPIYEYQCPKCEAEVEKLMRLRAPDPKCGECAKQGDEVEMARKVSQGSFQLRGGGWYSDGYSG